MSASAYATAIIAIVLVESLDIVNVAFPILDMEQGRKLATQLFEAWLE